MAQNPPLKRFEDDVIIACENGQITAPRYLLSNSSCYLRRILLEFAEKYPGQKPMVILQDLKYNDVRILINYMHDGKLASSLDSSQTLQKAAEILCIDNLLGITKEHTTAYDPNVHRVVALEDRSSDQQNQQVTNNHQQTLHFTPQSLANLERGSMLANKQHQQHQQLNTSMLQHSLVNVNNINNSSVSQVAGINSGTSYSNSAYIENPQAYKRREKKNKQSPNKYPTSTNAINNAFNSPFNAQSAQYVYQQNAHSSRPRTFNSDDLGTSHIILEPAQIINSQQVQRKGSGKRKRVDLTPAVYAPQELGQNSDVKNRIRCPWCVKTLSSKYNLERHIKNIHGSAEQGLMNMQIISLGKYKVCPVCNKTMSSKFNLQRHMKNLHGGLTALPETTNSSSKNPSRYKVACQLCSKTLSHKYNLDRHMKNVHKTYQ